MKIAIFPAVIMKGESYKQQDWLPSKYWTHFLLPKTDNGLLVRNVTKRSHRGSRLQHTAESHITKETYN